MKGLLSCGGASPLVREPAALGVVGELEPIFAPDKVVELSGLEVLLESFFFKLPNMVLVDDA